MRRLRRFTALFTGLLLLQTTLAGAGLACIAHGHEGGGALSGGAGPHATHSAVAMTEGDAAGTQPSAALSGQGTGTCNLAGLMGDCASVASCAPVVLRSAASVTTEIVAQLASVPAGRSLTPPTRSTAPDHPPPRA